MKRHTVWFQLELQWHGHTHTHTLMGETQESERKRWSVDRTKGERFFGKKLVCDWCVSLTQLNVKHTCASCSCVCSYIVDDL